MYDAKRNGINASFVVCVGSFTSAVTTTKIYTYIYTVYIHGFSQVRYHPMNPDRI